MEKNYDQLLKEGITALDAGQANRALERFEAAAELEERPEVLSYLAVCLATVRQEFATAERLCREAIEDDPRNALHYLNLGRVLLLADRKPEAIRVLRNGLLRQSNPKIKQELQRLGIRKYPVISSLPREHLLNRLLGKIFTSLKLR
jgi:Flp pilus assembly protein TadD